MLRSLFFLFFCYPLAALAQQMLPDLFPYKKGDLWGYADHTGKLIIPPRFVRVEPFSYNIGQLSDTIYMSRPAARVELPGNKVLFIDSTGAPAIPGFPDCSDIQTYRIEDTKWVVVSGAASVLIDTAWNLGQKPVPAWYSAFPYWGRWSTWPLESPALLGNWDETTPSGTIFFAAYPKPGARPAFGLLSPALDTLIPGIYQALSNYSDGLAVAAIDSLPGRSLLLDARGNILRTFPYELAFRIADNRIAARNALPDQRMFNYPEEKNTQRWGFIDPGGRVVIPFRYLQVRGFCHGIAMGERTPYNWDILDTAGQVLGTLREERPETASDIIALYPDSGLIPCPGGFFYKPAGQDWWTIYGPGMRTKLPYQFPDIPDWFTFWQKPFYVLRQPDFRYVILSKQNMVLAESDIEPGSLSSPGHRVYYRLKRNGKTFLTDEHFHDLTSSRYDSVGEYWINSLLVVEKAGQFGAIDTALREILTPRWAGVGLPEAPGNAFIWAWQNDGASTSQTQQSETMYPLARWTFRDADEAEKSSAASVFLGQSEEGYWLCNGPGNCKNLGFAYDSIFFSGGVPQMANEAVLTTRKGARYGLLDGFGRQLLPPVFRNIFITADQRAVVATDASVALYELRPFRQLMPDSKYETCWNGGSVAFRDTAAATAVYGFWHPGRQQIVWGDLIPTGFWKNGLLPVKKPCSNRSFFVNQNLEPAFPKDFEFVESFQDGLALVAFSDTAGIIDTAGHWVFQKGKYRGLDYRSGYIVERLQKTGGHCLYDRQGNLVDSMVHSVDENWPGIGLKYSKKFGDNYVYFMLDTAGHIVLDSCSAIWRHESTVLYCKGEEVLEYGTPRQGRYQSFSRRGAVPVGDDLWLQSFKYYGTGLFRGDGTCLIPMTYQEFEFHPEDKRVLVHKRNGSKVLFDYEGHCIFTVSKDNYPAYISGKGLLWWNEGTGRFVNLDGKVFDEP